MPAEFLLKRRRLERAILDQMQFDPGAISSQAAVMPILPGRATGCQPSDSRKKATDRDTSRVASVMCASAMPLVLAALGL